MSAAMYYGYTDRVPGAWHIGVDDVIVPGAVKRTVTTRLEGFKEPNIYTYSLESTIESHRIVSVRKGIT